MLKPNYMDKLIGLVDQFGGDVGVTIQGNRKVYKTWFGALGTIIIYSVGALYFLYLFILFVTNQIPPNIAYMPNYIQHDREYSITKPLMAIKFFDLSDYVTQDPNKILYTARIYEYHNAQELVLTDTLKLKGCADLIEGNSLEGFLCVNQPYDISLDFSAPGKEHYLTIDIAECDEKELEPGQYCAEKSDITKSSKSIFVQVVAFMEEYDHTIKQSRQVMRYFYLYMQQNQGFNFLVQLTDLTVDQGWLFRTQEQSTAVRGVQSTTFLFDPIAVQKSYNYTYALVTRFQITLDPQIINTSINFPKVGALLAEFQSVFSIVLILGILIKALAEQLGNHQIAQSIAKRFFPTATDDQVNKLLKDDNPENPFANLAQLKSLESILIQLIELRMIVSLLMDSSQVKEIPRLGMDLFAFEEQFRDNISDEKVGREIKHKVIPQDQSSEHLERDGNNDLHHLQVKDLEQGIGTTSKKQERMPDNHLNRVLLYQLNLIEPTKRVKFLLQTATNQDRFALRFESSLQ